MSVLVAAALLVGLFATLPAVAHLLRRGRASERPFPPASLVPASRTVARRERRLEDRALFSLRALVVLILAALGATPLVRCSRLALTRGAGGSVAIAIVLDDSLSMRAVPADGQARFHQALAAARDILDSAREGDAITIVLAGRPARVALGTTTDLGVARRTLAELGPSDRATDLAAAVGLARAALVDRARPDRRLIVLSDFAGDALPPGEPPAWAPLPALARALPDCGVVAAERHGRSIRATLACNDAAAATGRALELIPLEGSGTAPASGMSALGLARKPALTSASIEARVGVQTVTLDAGTTQDALAVRLSGSDRLAHDDVAPVAPEAALLGIAVVGSASGDESPTGGPPLLEQAIGALEAGATLHPLSMLPDQASDLATFALIVLDDPPGLSPEARQALTGHVERGGVAAAFLGPRSEVTKLGSTLEPFVRGSIHWDRAPSPHGASAPSLAWLGVEASSLSELGLKGRALLDPGGTSGARLLGTLTDGAPFLVERALGRGSLFTLVLPSSLDQSELALRPGFVALLSHLIETARQAHGVRQGVAGGAWRFTGDHPRVEGPEGALEVRETPDGRSATPVVRGLYRVLGEGRDELRTVTLDASEITLPPAPPPAAQGQGTAAASAGSVDVSSEAALALLSLLALEVALRVARVARLGRQKPAR